MLPVELWEAGQIWSTPRHARNSPFWNSRIEVSEPSWICEPAEDLFALPSFHLKLPLPQFPWCRLPPSGSGQGRTSPWAISYQAASRNTDFPSSARIYPRWAHGKWSLCIPSGFFTPLLSRTWVQMYPWCSSRESETFSFPFLTLKHHHWLSVTCLQAWLILCKTEDFTAILQKDLKSPDFP